MADTAPRVGRRSLLTGTAAGIAGAAVVGAGRADAAPPVGPIAPRAGYTEVTPASPQYPDLITAVNPRWTAQPAAVRLAVNTEQVVAAVQDAVRAGKRITVRSGGHCLEDFVYNPEVEIILDLSNLNQVTFDASRNAFAVEPGATLLEVYEKLYGLWGVTLPGGICYSVGIGGHVAGGGWGMLCRSRGLIVDYLVAVEVVVVDANGRARAVIATSDLSDPNRELWWAHTGGGGGNFGVVTRYWFRSPGAQSRNPADLLPKPPRSVLLSAVSWPWASLSRSSFSRLLKNYGAWHVANVAPDSPARALSSFLIVNHISHGEIGLVTQVDATVPRAQEMLDSWLTAMHDGVGVTSRALTSDMGEFAAMPQFAAPRRLPWLQATRFLGTTNATLNDPTLRADYKSAYMRRNFPDRQVAALYRHFTRGDIDNKTASLAVSSFGGQVNAVSPGDTAFPHRTSAFKLLWQVWWSDPADDAKYVGWARESYRDVYAETGGVPVPNEVTDGCYVNYADTDLNDPVQNASGVPWYTLYYKENYPRLQRIKRRWDPRDVFRHTQSVRLPGA